MKTLVVGDLHLMDRELSSTKGAIENNRIMLENIYNYLDEHTDIGLVVFLGDIQHRTPKDLKLQYEWKEWFFKIGVLMKSRLDPSIKFKFRDGSTYLPSTTFPIVCVRGNHDNEKTMQRPTDFTFFDALLKDEYIINPQSVVFKDGENIVYYDLRNYGEADRELSPAIQDKAITIGFTHDNIQTDNSSDMIKMIVNESGGYRAEEIGKGLDILLNGHIHSPQPLEIVTVEETAKPCIFKVVGSMARTSSAKENFRDVGYCLEVDTSEPDNADLSVVTLDVMPFKEYFDISLFNRRTEIKKSYQDFNLGLEDVEIDTSNLEDSIRTSRVKDNRVIEKTLELLKLVDEDIEKEDFGI